MQNLKDLIKRIGGVNCVSRMCGLTPPTVSTWRTIPAEHCLSIERATEGAWRCEQLRPDLDWAVLRNSDCPKKVAA